MAARQIYNHLHSAAPISTQTHTEFRPHTRRWDYGAILLADERFGSQQNQRQLSKWLRQHLVGHPSFGGAIGSLTKFFKVRLRACV